MKQIYILYVFIIGLATACGNKMVKGNEEAAKDSDFMLDGPSMEYHPTEHDIKMNELAVQEIAVVNQVTEIYEAVNKAYNSKNWQQETAKLDKTYCSKDWNATVAAVRDKDKGTDDIGFFDADYWVMGQDWSEDIHASDIKLKDIDLEVYGLTPKALRALLGQLGAVVSAGGEGMEMTALSCLAIGGISLSGGRGSVIGTFLGCRKGKWPGGIGSFPGG